MDDLLIEAFLLLPGVLLSLFGFLYYQGLNNPQVNSKKIAISLALGVALPFFLASVYALLMYGNATGSIGMGGIEVIMYLVFVAGPFALLSFIIFLGRIVFLRRKNFPIRQEIIYFFVSVVLLGGAGIGIMYLANYCEMDCRFIPEQRY